MSDEIQVGDWIRVNGKLAEVTHDYGHRYAVNLYGGDPNKYDPVGHTVNKGSHIKKVDPPKRG